MSRRLLHRAMAALALSIGGPASAVEPLVAASADDHAWFVASREAAGGELRHLAADTEGPYFDRGLSMLQVPEAMAAWGDQLWLMFPGAQGHEAFTVDVAPNPAFGGWYQRPTDRMTPVATLERAGALCGLVGTARGPVALVRPEAEAPGLLELRGGQWQALDLPAGLEARSELRLASGGTEGQTLIVMAADGGSSRTNVYWRDPQGAWSASEVDFAIADLRGAARVGSATALLLEGPAAGACRIAYLRPGGLLPLVEFTVPAAQRCALVGLRDGLALVDEDRGGESWARHIDGHTGESGPRERLGPRPLLSGRMLHWPLLAAGMITGLMVVLLLGPRPGGAITLPADTAPLGVSLRVGAFLADAAIAGAIVLLILRCPLPDLLRSPLLTTDLERSIPFLLTAGLTVVIGTAGELIAGRSPGKALVVARVVTTSGTRPSAAAIIVRNVFKAMVILIPVLAVIALLSPNVQGLGDLIARTMVVRSTAASAKDR